MNKSKSKRLSIIILLSSFLLTGCGRDIHSYEFLTKQVQNDLSEIYSVSSCATIKINKYVEHSYPNHEKLKIHMKSSNVLVYGVDSSDVEKLVFIPSYRTSKIYKFALDNKIKYLDIVSYIQNEHPTIEKEQIKATLVEYEIIENLLIILGFPIIVDDITTVYYVQQNEIHSYIVS